MDTKEERCGSCTICVLLADKIRTVVRAQYKTNVVANLVVATACALRTSPLRIQNSTLEKIYDEVSRIANDLVGRCLPVSPSTFLDQRKANIIKTNWNKAMGDDCEEILDSLAIKLLTAILETTKDGTCI